MAIEITPLPTVNEAEEFTATISVNDVTEGALGSPGISTPVTDLSATFNPEDEGIKITSSGNTLTISGSYQNVFNKRWELINLEDRETVKTTIYNRYDKIPLKFNQMIKYTPNSASSVNVTFTVKSSNVTVGSVTQTVNTNWTTGRNQLVDLIAERTTP